MKRTDLAYFAGIFDGEGTVGLPPMQKTTKGQRTTYGLAARVSSTDEWLCQRLKFAFGGSICTREQGGNFKTIYCWTVRHIKACEFLRAILPYLHLKRDRAELGLEFQARKKWGGSHHPQEYIDLEADYKKLMLEMNKRGK